MNNTTIAVDRETRDRINNFVTTYNKKRAEHEHITAKTFIKLALDIIEQQNDDEQKDFTKQKGILYLVQSVDLMKIGYTSNLINLKKRIKAYRTHNPHIQMIGIIDGGIELEKYFHDKLETLPECEFAYYNAEVWREFTSNPNFIKLDGYSHNIEKRVKL